MQELILIFHGFIKTTKKISIEDAWSDQDLNLVLDPA
jgi:hypothetical protein